jgi:hypothetical protein
VRLDAETLGVGQFSGRVGALDLGGLGPTVRIAIDDNAVHGYSPVRGLVLQSLGHGSTRESVRLVPLAVARVVRSGHSTAYEGRERQPIRASYRQQVNTVLAKVQVRDSLKFSDENRQDSKGVSNVAEHGALVGPVCAVLSEGIQVHCFGCADGVLDVPQHCSVSPVRVSNVTEGMITQGPAEVSQGNPESFSEVLELVPPPAG